MPPPRSRFTGQICGGGLASGNIEQDRGCGGGGGVAVAAAKGLRRTRQGGAAARKRWGIYFALSLSFDLLVCSLA